MIDGTSVSYTSICNHYGRLAAVYDRKWRRYNERTLNAVMDALALSGGERLLDVGCGTGELARVAVQRIRGLRVVGIDAAPAMIAVGRKKLLGAPQVTFEIGRAEALPFGDEQFDTVVSASMLHHAQDPDRVLRECLRVLRPGGQLVVVDWCLDFRRSRLLHAWLRIVDRTYARMYGAQELRQRMEGLGAAVHRAERFLAPPGYGMMCLKGVKGAKPT